MASTLSFTSSENPPHWFSPETGIYSSTHPSIDLPSDPFLDAVSFIFSHRHDASSSSALVDSSSGFSISHSELHPLVLAAASGLHHLGLSRGDVVLILLPNSVFYPVAFLAALRLGAVVTTMNPLSTVAEIEGRVSDCNARLVFALPNRVEELKGLGLDLPVVAVPENVGRDWGRTYFLDLEKMISGGFGLENVGGDWGRTQTLDLEKVISGGFGVAPRVVIEQDDAAAILYSSGTTGMSKGVVLTHRNLIAAVELFVRFEASQYEDLSSGNVYLAVIPMFHIYGLSLFVLGLLSLGSTVVVMRKFDANQVVDVIDRYRVTHFPVVPPLLVALTRKAKGVVDKGRLRSLKQVSCGAAPLSRNVFEEFHETLPHVDFIQGYGMTESTAVGTRGFNTGKFQKYLSVGLLAPNMQAKVVDWNTGSLLPPGSSGELWLRGPGVMKEYLNNKEATLSTIDKDNWLHTGDIVYFDWDGYIHICDRLKEMIKYKGYQIAPADIEAVLIAHPDILDVAVTSAMDEESGEIPVAFVVRAKGSSLSHIDVIDYLAKRVAPYKKVRKVMFTQSIPKSAAGKVLRRELKKLLNCRL